MWPFKKKPKPEPEPIPGPIGPQGDEGYQGATGHQGERGPTGLPGPPGPTGPCGAGGARGVPGVTGGPGLPGIRGERGDRGDRGLDGHAGRLGPTGGVGQDGPTGSVGTQGTKGERGFRGRTAEKVIEDGDPTSQLDLDHLTCRTKAVPDRNKIIVRLHIKPIDTEAHTLGRLVSRDDVNACEHIVKSINEHLIETHDIHFFPATLEVIRHSIHTALVKDGTAPLGLINKSWSAS